MKSFVGQALGIIAKMANTAEICAAEYTTVLYNTICHMTQ